MFKAPQAEGFFTRTTHYIGTEPAPSREDLPVTELGACSGNSA
jgi:hypothetical protein